MWDRLKRLAGHPHRFRMAFAYLLVHTGLHRFVTIDYFGVKLRLSPCHLGLYFFAYPGYRRDDVAVLRRWLRAGDLYVDVGANLGSLAAVASLAVGDTGRVVAFEPHPKTFRYLLQNGRPNITAICAALGDEPGVARLTDIPADDQNRISGYGDIAVRVTRLDDAVGPGRVRLLKIDVEGYELHVLRGAKEVLGRTDAVYLEVSDELFAAFGYATGGVIELLESAGFAVTEADSSPYAPVLDRGAARNLIAARRAVMPTVAESVAPLPMSIRA